MKLPAKYESALEQLKAVYSDTPIGNPGIGAHRPKCRRCKSSRTIRCGFVKGKQRYECKGCGYHFTTHRESKPNKKIKKAKNMYLEGLGLRSIGRLLDVSHVSILQWLKREAAKHRWVLPAMAEVIELDELFYYVGNKKRRRVLWLAVCRHTGRILTFRTGCRSEGTGRKLYSSIAPVTCNRYCTDYYRVYRNFLPQAKHITSKAETYTIEGMNSMVRHYLARFRRRTKCYSKSEHMVGVTMRLFMDKVNGRAA